MVRKFSLPRGTSDILPAQIPLWQELETKARRLLCVYNYSEIRTPLFEETDLFARSMGQTSDVVSKQMLNLASQKLDENNNLCLSGLSLRPEGTASVVRSYIQNNIDKKESLTKLFYIGSMFRGERPQKGRLRQFNQIGVEAIGPNSDSPYLDAEVISLCVNLLKSFGLNDFTLKINSLGSSEDKESFSKQLREQFESKQDDLCDDCKDRIDRNVFRVLDCKVKSCKDVVKTLSLDLSFLSPQSSKYYSEVKKVLDSLNVQYQEDYNLVRGLDYYTHTVFEITSGSLGSQDALGAGGRYNNLVSDLGGSSDVNAIGFALGVERILLALAADQTQAQRGPDIFFVPLGEQAFKKAFQLLDILRKENLMGDINYNFEASPKSQMRLANKIGAKFVIVLGEDEIARQTLKIKDMKESTEEEVSFQGDDFSNIVNILKERVE